MALLNSPNKPELPSSGIGTGHFVEVNGVSAYQPPNSTVSFKPNSNYRTVTSYKTIALPKKDYLKYEGAEEQPDTIALKGVFGTTPQQRRQYVSDVKKFNEQVKSEKKKIEDYNKQVKEWNEKGRFQKVKETFFINDKTYDITITKTKTVPVASSMKMPEPFINTKTGTITEAPKQTTVEKVTPWVAQMLPTYRVYKAVTSGEAKSFMSSAKQSWQTFKQSYIQPTIKGFDITLSNPSEAGRILKSESLPSLKLGSEIVWSAVKQKYNEIDTGARIIETNPREAGRILKSESLPALYTGVDISKNYVVNLLSTPEGRGKALWFATETYLYAGGGKQLIRSGAKQVKNLYIRTGAKYVPPEQVFSSQVFNKEGELTTSLVRTKSVKGAFGSLGKTKKVYPEYPKHYVLQTSQPQALPKQFKVMSQAEKKAQGLTVRNLEDPGVWYGVKGEGAVWPFRISGDYKYKFSILPKMQQTSNPSVLETLVKRGERLPKKVLETKGLTKISEYQQYIARTKPSTALFPRRSEVSKIGYPNIRTAIKKVEPNVRGSSELQFVLGESTIIKPAQKFLKTNIIKFKGYGEYTEAFGQLIPIRKGIVSGASIYTPGKLPTGFSNMKPLEIGQSGKLNWFIKTDKKISKTFENQLSRFGESSFFKAIKSGSTKDPYLSAYKNYLAEKTLSYTLPYGKIGSLQYSKTPTYNDYRIMDDNSRNQEPPYKPTDIYGEKDTSRTVEDTYKYTEPGRDVTYEKTTYNVREPTYTPGYPSPPNLTYRYPNPVKRTTVLRPVIPKSKKKQQAIGEPAYDVFIKVGNKWVNKTQGQRNFYSAVDRGSKIVDNSIAKSFKIKKGTGIAKIFKSNLPYNINKFYQPSKRNDVRLTGAYIEKSKYAIDTPGEKKGLSVAKYLRGAKII